MSKLTEDEKGNIVAKAVWDWLQNQKRVEYVPWITDPDDRCYDPFKAIKQDGRQELLGQLQSFIAETSQKLNEDQ